MAKRRGPAPQSAKVKRAKGNPGKRKILTDSMDDAVSSLGAGGADLSKNESIGAKGGLPSLSPPDWLVGDGLIVWKKLAPRLQSLKILQLPDVETFARYCVNFARWISLQENLAKHGETYKAKTAHGNYIKANPAFMMVSRLDRELMMMEANFALNPVDRQRLFAARAAVGAGGADLFSNPSGGGDGDSSSSVVDKGPVGLLN